MRSSATIGLFYRDLGARWLHDDSRWRPSKEKNGRKRVQERFARCAPLKQLPRLETWKGLQGTCRPRARSGPGRPTDRRGRSLAGAPRPRSAPGAGPRARRPAPGDGTRQPLRACGPGARSEAAAFFSPRHPRRPEATQHGRETTQRYTARIQSGYTVARTSM